MRVTDDIRLSVLLGTDFLQILSDMLKNKSTQELATSSLNTLAGYGKRTMFTAVSCPYY